MAKRVFKDQPLSIDIDNLRVLLEKTRVENLMYRLPICHYYNRNKYSRHSRITEDTEQTGDTGIIIHPSNLKITEEPASYSGIEDTPTQTPLTVIYNTVLNLPTTNPLISELGTTYSAPTLTSTGHQNVYKAFSKLVVDGILTLIGGSCDQFYFIAGSTIGFSTVNPVTIILSGGLQESNIFWVSQSSITVNSSSFLSGILIADETIVCSGTSTLFGAAFARNAAVTLADTTEYLPIIELSDNYSKNEGIEYLSIGSTVSSPINTMEITKYTLRAPQN
jgi:hypothetical protein